MVAAEHGRLAEAKLRRLDTRIAEAERARTMVQRALACPHRNLATCPNFRAALRPYLDLREVLAKPADIQRAATTEQGRARRRRNPVAVTKST